MTGLRTIELIRSSQGFGFTLSGQRPCLLSSIVSGSPADKAKLMAGNYVLSINSKNVSALPHDDVVRLIGNTSGILRLTISETYTPELHKKSLLRHVDLMKCDELILTENDFNSLLNPALQELRKNYEIQNENTGLTARLRATLLKIVVGYLGTIEMPESGGEEGKLTGIRNCIRRLRIEKRIQCRVLLAIYEDRVCLFNHIGTEVATYKGEEISFCGMCRDDKRFFGLVTTRTKCSELPTYNSCHVFMTESPSDPQEIQKRIQSFSFAFHESSPEFPLNALPILNTIKSMYGKSKNLSKLDLRAMPDPSHESSFSSHESSFNSERLDSQNSAANLRSSMQKYLESKSKHLERVSTSLLRNENSKKKFNFLENSESLSGLLPINSSLSFTQSSDTFARSLEDIRDENQIQFPIPHLIRYLNYTSDSHLNVASVSPKALMGPLKPSEQYPSAYGGGRGVLSSSKSSVAPTSESSASSSPTKEANGGDVSWSRNSSLKKSGKDGETEIESVGRVESWSLDFDKLLYDPAGLHTFAEFLKKEISHENIYFWVATERYRLLTNETDRQSLAKSIVERFLVSGAPEPVNVDSSARSSVFEALSKSQTQTQNTLFLECQKQIYNLMKFDSYSRFLKSPLYKDCLSGEASGKSLLFNGNDGFESELRISPLPETHSSLKKSISNRRKSILPFALLSKDRSKSKDRNQLGRNVSETTNCSLARVILPDQATTVVQTRPGETIKELVSRLLEKRGLVISSFDVFHSEGEETDKPLDLNAECSSLGCSEVKVEPRVLFRLTLPSQKSIGVKAKPGKLIKDVLGPILLQYGWNMSSVSIKSETGGLIRGSCTIATLDNLKLVVSPRSIDEINSKLLEDLLKEKNSNERNSFYSQMSSVTDDEKLAMPPPCNIPLHRSAQLRKKDEYYDGLKIVSRGRLEDQRGTDINFEMPEFLKKGKNKENLSHRHRHFSNEKPIRRTEKLGLVEFEHVSNDNERSFSDIDEVLYSCEKAVSSFPSGAYNDSKILEYLGFNAIDSNGNSSKKDPPPLPPKPKMPSHNSQRASVSSSNERGFSVSLV